MIRFSFLILLCLIQLSACRSGHFEDRTTRLKDSAEELKIEAILGRSYPVASVSKSKAKHVDITLTIQTRDANPQWVRNQLLNLELSHPSLESPKILTTTTNEEGRFSIAMDLSPNEEGSDVDVYSVKVKLQTQAFGDHYGILDLDLRNSNSTPGWRESSKSQFDQVVRFDLGIEADREAFLRSWKSVSPAEFLYTVELRFQIFQSEKNPLVGARLHASLRSDVVKQDFELPPTDSNGYVILSFEIPAKIYGPFDPFMGVFNFEMERHDGKVSKSKAVLISLPDSTHSQSLSVVSRDSLAALESPAKTIEPARLEVDVNEVKRGNTRISTAASLDLQQTQDFDLNLGIKLLRQGMAGTWTEKSLQNMPISVQWMLVHSAQENLDSKSVVIAHQKDDVVTDWSGRFHLKTQLFYSDLKSKSWPANIVMAIEVPSIKGLPTIFLKFEEQSSRITFLSRAEADQLLGGALVRGPTSREKSKPTLVDKKYLVGLQPLADLFKQDENISGEGQIAVTQLQTLLSRPPAATDAVGMQTLYTLLAKVAKVKTSDIGHSFQWEELLFVEEITKQNLIPSIIDEEFSSRLNRNGNFESSAYSFELSGSAQTCYQFKLWKVGTRDEFTSLYWCNPDSKKFGPTIEPYLLLTPPREFNGILDQRLPNFLIRGATTLRELKSKLTPRNESDRINIIELLQQYDQSSRPEKKNLIVRSIYPTAR